MAEPRRRGGPRQRGQALVEFALCLPLLAIIMVGAWNVGKAAYDAEILQESTTEAGKVAAIDRLNIQQDDSYSLSDPELLAWIRAAAHTADPTINPTSIKCDAQGNSPAWNYDGGEFPPGMGNATGPVKLVQDIAGGSLGPLKLQDINPSLETMRVVYNYDLGLSTGGSFPIRYRYYFTRYAYTWFPFSAGGSLSHASC